MRHLLACMLWLLTVLPVSAQDTATAERMVTAFEGWMQDKGATKGTIAVRYKGKPFLQHGMNLAADTPVEMASLSKAITGVCVAELVRSGVLNYDARFVDLVGRGPSVTVAQLLSQNRGLHQNSTQDIMLASVGKADDHAEDVLDAIVARGGPLKKLGQQYRYNNENYALLSLVIEAASGKSYGAVCTDLVLDLAGAKSVKSEMSHGFLAWGGWKMTTDDYAAFFTHWFGGGAPLGRDPFSLPHVNVEGGVQYGHGMFFRAFRGDHNFWHHGALCFPGKVNTGSFAVSWKGAWSAVAVYDICPDKDAMLDLDTALSRAVFQ